MRKTSCLLAVMFCLLTTTYGQSKKKLIKEGNKLYNDSSFNLAEMKYRKSLEKDQDYFNAAFNLADAVYKQKRYQEATSFFEALKDNAKNNQELSQINHNLGNSLFKENKIDQAIDAYKNSLRQNPNDEETRYNLAYAQKIKQQQQQQQQQQNKDQDQDQDKEKEEKDQNQDQEKKNDNKEQKENDQKNQEEKKDEMSKEDAKKMLEALQQKEKELQEKLQKKKIKGQKIKILKDW